MRWIAFLFAVATSVQGEKPFEFATTPGKLPKSIRPTEYAIHIEPDIDSLSFTGTETVKLAFEKPAREIVFNAVELSISGARLDNAPLSESSIKMDPNGELATIVLDHDLPAGDHTLTLNFAGKINLSGRGLFYGTYQEQGTNAKKTFLGTQFESTDARRLFPCWDEPAFRARFQLTATVPENWMAVSNMPAVSERPIAKGREVVFGMTPPMPTYLNVFCAGEFDSVESAVDGVKLRIVTTKGKAETARYALESTEKILRYYNDYFGVPYPLPKLDQIAIPGGFGGAMENWGGITYYETALLFDPQNSSTATKQRVFEVIAHEIAHQWFGDLVTMAWWDNLWLNEGFASWMGSKCTAHFNPEWEVWLQKAVPRDPARRVGIPKEQAMEADARITTHPVQQTVATEADADSAFDDITYNKGEAFIRMLESFLGENYFRDGIRQYINAHKYSNSTTADLWNALNQASGKPVSEIAAGWTQQPGFPVVSVQRTNNNTAVLTQERFTINFKENRSALWKIPLTYFADGRSRPDSVLMADHTTALEGIQVDRALKLNVEGTGIYRAAYDDASWNLLMNGLGRMTVPNKVNLLSDAWAFVEAGRQPLMFYTTLIERLPRDSALAVREQIINALSFIDHLLADVSAREQFRAYARRILRPTLDDIGMQPKKGEPASTSLLRSSLVQALGLTGDQEVLKRCRQNFDSYLEDPSSLSPDLRAQTFAVVMRYGDRATWEKLHSLGVKTASTEEKQDFYDALAFANKPDLINKTLAIALTDELPTSRAVFLVSRVARESDRPDLAWDFARTNFNTLQKKLDALGANSYFPRLFTFFSDVARIDELREFARKNLSEGSVKPVEIAADELRFRADFRNRLTTQLKSQGR